MALGFGYKFGFSRAGGLDPATVSFKQRVEADGGTVEDVNFLNSFITNAKNNNYYDDIVAAYSPSWGVKGTTTASDLYSITGAAYDLAQGTASKQLAITAAAENGKSILTADGIDDIMQRAFTYEGPETVILLGLRMKTWTISDLFFDGLTGGVASGAVQMRVSSNRVALNVGGFGVSDVNVDLGVDTAAHLRALFNDPSGVGALQIDANAEVTTTLPTNVNMGGFSLGGSAIDSLWANISVGTILLLNSAVDGNYAAKMAAIYNFSQSAYGTP
jgi:hypothetical protein